MVVVPIALMRGLQTARILFGESQLIPAYSKVRGTCAVFVYCNRDTTVFPISRSSDRELLLEIVRRILGRAI